MVQTQLIAAYEQLLEQSRRLLECAENSDWDGLFTLKSQGLIDAAYLRRTEENTELDDSARQRKRELITQILELESQVMHSLIVRQHDLHQLMLVNRRNSDLNNAYRAPLAEPRSVTPMSLHLYQKR
ncbi:MAG TPA: flagellar protein FliT [Pseudomonas sp.]|jgi:flagellar protein FliT|uniref:flagellar protein FliT n=1 Tax=Pseudomonas sp. TaxID=306 RepID=UPI002EDA2FDA